MLSTIFLERLRLIKCSSFIHCTLPYINPRLDSPIEHKFSDWEMWLKLKLTYSHAKSGLDHGYKTYYVY